MTENSSQRPIMPIKSLIIVQLNRKMIINLYSKKVLPIQKQKYLEQKYLESFYMYYTYEPRNPFDIHSLGVNAE